MRCLFSNPKHLRGISRYLLRSWRVRSVCTEPCLSGFFGFLNMVHSRLYVYMPSIELGIFMCATCWERPHNTCATYMVISTWFIVEINYERRVREEGKYVSWRKIDYISDAVKDVGNYSTHTLITVFLLHKKIQTINLLHFQRESMINGHYGGKNKLKTNTLLDWLFETPWNTCTPWDALQNIRRGRRKSTIINSFQSGVRKHRRTKTITLVQKNSLNFPRWSAVLQALLFSRLAALDLLP